MPHQRTMPQVDHLDTDRAGIDWMSSIWHCRLSVIIILTHRHDPFVHWMQSILSPSHLSRRSRANATFDVIMIYVLFISRSAGINISSVFPSSIENNRNNISISANNRFHRFFLLLAFPLCIRFMQFYQSILNSLIHRIFVNNHHLITILKIRSRLSWN